MPITLTNNQAEEILRQLLDPNGESLFHKYCSARDARETELSELLCSKSKTANAQTETIALLQADITDLRERLAGKVEA